MKIEEYVPRGIYKFFTTGHHRTITLKRNALGAFLLKGFDIILGFIRIPIIISFLSVTEYGIWITLSSIIMWFSFFDIGLSSGLKTKLAEALAIKDYKLAKIYISTTYATITIIVSAAFIIFLIFFPLLNWGKILNVPLNISSQIGSFVFVFVSLFTIQFVMNIITTVLTADQKPALGSAIGAFSSVIYLLLLIVLNIFTKGTLLHLTIACNGTTAIVFLAASIYFYKNGYKEISPSLKFVDFNHFRSLASLGFKFFFLKITGIIMFSTDNMIITQLFTPADVAPYNISFKYMGIPLMLFSLITWPLWTAFTDAYTVKDYEWIRMIVKKLIYLWIGLIAAECIALLLSDSVYYLWLKGTVQITFILSAFMGINSVIVGWNQIYVNFINGVGKIKLQLYMGIITVIMNIPLSIYFAKNLKLGPSGVIMATNVCLFIGSIWAPIQYHKIINNNARGVWNQ